MSSSGASRHHSPRRHQHPRTERRRLMDVAHAVVAELEPMGSRETGLLADVILTMVCDRIGLLVRRRWDRSFEAIASITGPVRSRLHDRGWRFSPVMRDSLAGAPLLELPANLTGCKRLAMHVDVIIARVGRDGRKDLRFCLHAGLNDPVRARADHEWDHHAN